MKCSVYSAIAAVLLMASGAGAARAPQTAAPQRINLAERLSAGTLRPVNRKIAALADRRDSVQVAEGADPGVIWIDGSNFSDGTIELDVRGRDVVQRSFVGLAFHGVDDHTYEAVYLRPFNFRTDDQARHHHAVQYMASPDYDWPRLRQEFPEQFENAVDPAVAPSDWVSLRVVVNGASIQVFVGPAKSPTLAVRKLGQHDRGMVGLWTGNNSGGDFANLRLTPLR